MADTTHEGMPEDKPAHPAAPIETGAWQAGLSSRATAGDATTKPVPSGFPKEVQIADASATEKSPAERQFDAHEAAAEINDALHVPFFSTRFFPDGDKVFNKMLNMTPGEFKATEAAFNRTQAPGDKPWTLQDDIHRQLSSSQTDRLDKLMESKSHNHVPPERRVDGEQLLKPGSPLKVGEINAVTMPDGRRYDVYVPKNADNRAPTVVAMHGAAGGDSVGLIAQAYAADRPEKVAAVVSEDGTWMKKRQATDSR
ncbi:MAG: hypothetical protein KGS72_19450 [Cyanobacteria bacterium REEB67]|nr:hypothetical protein [Cyanobacteria bacterium REEB67]